MYSKVTHLSNSMEFQDSSLPVNVFVFAGMSGLSSNFGMPVSMYSGQAAVAQTAMSMSSMPGGSFLYFCFRSIPVYLYLYFTRHVSDVRHVGSRFSSHFSSDQFLPGIVCVLFLLHFLYLCISCASFVFEFFLYLKFFFQVSSSPLASVMHNSAIGAMT